MIEDCEDVVDVLVQHGADLNIKDADLWTPLHAAVACGNYELVKYLVDNGASLVEINTDGNMPIDLVEDNEDVEIFLDEAMAKAGKCSILHNCCFSLQNFKSLFSHFHIMEKTKFFKYPQWQYEVLEVSKSFFS